MKQKTLLFAVLLMTAMNMQAQIFTLVCPTGHSLEYSVNPWDTTTVSVTYCNPSNWGDNIELVIPETVCYNGRTYVVTRIDPWAGAYQYESITNFYNFHPFKHVTLPNTIRTLGYKAFGGSGITSINLPDSLDTIGPWAFCSCRQLEDIIIPNNIKYVGQMAFTNCGSIGTLELPANVQTVRVTNPYWGGGSGTMNEEGENGGEGIVFGQIGVGWLPIRTNKVKNLYYDGSITGAPWGALHFSTFKEDGLYYADSTKTTLYGCDPNLGYAEIPNTVTTIANYAFFNCRNLYGIQIPSSVTIIGDSAFMGCINLTDVTIPANVDSIGNDAFYHVEYLNYSGTASGRPWGALYTNTDNVYCDIYDGLIYSNSNKKEIIGCIAPMNYVDIPESVESVRENAFELSKLYRINYHAINCTTALGLSHPEMIHLLLFNNSVQSIPDSCFNGCSALTSLTFPNSLTSIGASAFSGCSGITSITILATTPPTISANTFAGVPTDVDVVVPCGSLQAYLADSNWRYFTNIHTVGCPGIINAVASDSTMGTVTGSGSYNGGDTAVVVATSGVGHHFVAWSNGETVDTLRIVVNGDSTLTAYFAADTFTVAVTVNDTVMGTVAGGGPYLYGNSATLTATANPRHFFVRWDDNSTDNPRTVTVTQDTLFTAYFAQTIVDTVIEHDTMYIDVHDTTYIDVHYTAYIDVHDTTYIDVLVHDTTYIDVHDTTYIDVHDTTYIDVFVHDTTYVDVFVHDTTYVDVMVHDTTIVTDTLWLTQIDTLWLHDTIVIHDTVYITHEGIDGVETLNVKVYASNGQIVVDGAEGRTVTLYDVMGRKMTYSSPLTSFGSPSPNLGEELRIDVPVSGTYLIKIGDWPARKVVVLK